MKTAVLLLLLFAASAAADDDGKIVRSSFMIVATARRLAELLGHGGWRQHKHLLRSLKTQLRAINRIAASKGRDYRRRLLNAYRALLDMADRILARATELLDPAWFLISPGPASLRPSTAMSPSGGSVARCSTL